MTDETPKIKALLVDDDKFLLDMYTMKFTQQGFDVHACLSVLAALDVLRNGFVPDVIVFDIIMPEFDGFAFLKFLSDEKLAPKSVRIALTNQSDDAEMQHAQELGADKVLIKATMIPSEVVTVVKEVLATQSKV